MNTSLLRIGPRLYHIISKTQQEGHVVLDVVLMGCLLFRVHWRPLLVSIASQLIHSESKQCLPRYDPRNISLVPPRLRRITNTTAPRANIKRRVIKTRNCCTSTTYYQQNIGNYIMSRRIAALTQEGINSLQQRRYGYSILCFRHALECLKTTATRVIQESVNPEYGPTALPIESVPVTSGCEDAFAIHQASSPHNMFCVYQRAFALPSQHDVSTIQVEIAAVLFYNLALAHHLRGLCVASDSSSSSKHLRQAASCYKTSLMIFQSTTFDSPSWCPLLLALFNNMGFVLCHFWQLEEARACFKYVVEMLSLPQASELPVVAENFFFEASIHISADIIVQAAPAAWSVKSIVSCLACRWQNTFRKIVLHTTVKSCKIPDGVIDLLGLFLIFLTLRARAQIQVCSQTGVYFMKLVAR